MRSSVRGVRTGKQAADAERSRSSRHNRKRIAMHRIDLDEAKRYIVKSSNHMAQKINGGYKTERCAR